jgi:prevent-host-death family protein
VLNEANSDRRVVIRFRSGHAAEIGHSIVSRVIRYLHRWSKILGKGSTMAIVNMQEARTHLSRLVDRAVAGEEIVITRAGKPVARIQPVEDSPRRPGRGMLKGLVNLGDQAFEPLPDEMIGWFYGEGDTESLR